jgi:hypothetical protein
MTCLTAGLVTEIAIDLTACSRHGCIREQSAERLGVKMKRIAASVIVGIFVLTTVAIGTAVAHTFVAETNLTIRKAPRGATNPGGKVIVFGRLKSANPACRSNRSVRLMKVRPGPDKVLAGDRTDLEGDYRFVRHPGGDVTVYTRFMGTFNTSYGHSHKCLKDRSRNRVINVL